jgi:hypothetical protein
MKVVRARSLLLAGPLCPTAMTGMPAILSRGIISVVLWGVAWPSACAGTAAYGCSAKRGW